MELIEANYKEVNYFGIKLLVHHGVKFLAVNADGALYSYSKCPQYKNHIWITKGTNLYIGRVNLEFQPASSTLMEL